MGFVPYGGMRIAERCDILSSLFSIKFFMIENYLKMINRQKTKPQSNRGLTYYEFE